MSASRAIQRSRWPPALPSCWSPARPGADVQPSRVGGVHGRLLRVHLGEHGCDSWPEPIPVTHVQDVIGGIGLASALLLEHAPPGVDPLTPENPLIFATS